MKNYPSWVSAILPGIAAAGLLAATPAESAAVSERCASVTQAFIDSLTPDQRKRTVVPFDTGARQKWSFRPGSDIRKEGLAIGEMSDEQRVRAHRVLQCGLSSQGYQKAVAIMHLDDIVMANFHKTVFASLPGPVEIGHDFFWLTVFGDPAGEEAWGWQLEGHHLVQNFTVVGNDIAVTPAFMGAEPAEVHSGPLAGWRVLGQEVDLAFTFFESLTESQREIAVLSDTIPRNVLTGAPGQGDAIEDYEGLRASQMDGSQEELLWALIREYLNNADPALANRQLQKIRNAGLDQLYFAWMGPQTRGSPVYYRIHGPSVLIEYDHAQNLRNRERDPDPNHIHTIYRDPGNDYGDDWLRRHYAESSHHQ